MSRPGVVVEGLQLVKLLGEGPFGAVWLAKDLRKGAAVCVKLLRPHIANLPYGKTAFERLQTAIKAYVEITHPNVCPVLRTVYQPDEVAMGLASELVEGQTFDRLQIALVAPGAKRVDPKRLARVLYWFEQLGNVIGWLHARGVIHGNLKPTNVMVLQGSNASQLKILDLCWSAIGVAMPVAGAETFLAPEQLQGSAPVAASDQWSLALMLQRWLTPGGRKLTAAEGVPPALIAALEQALKKSPDARFSKIGDWVQVLARARKGLEQEMTEVAAPAHPSGAEVRRAPNKAGAATPQGFGEEPQTVKVPVRPPQMKRPPANGGPRASPSRGGEQLRASKSDLRADAVDIDFETGEFVASVKSEPALDFRGVTLPEEGSDERESEARAEKRVPPGVLWAAGLIAIVGVAAVYAMTQLGGPKSGENAGAAPGPPAVATAPAETAETKPPKTAEAPGGAAAKTPPPSAPIAEPAADKGAATKTKAEAVAPVSGTASSEPHGHGAADHGRGRKTKGRGARAGVPESKADEAMARMAALSGAHSAKPPAGSAQVAPPSAKSSAPSNADDLPAGGAKESEAPDLSEKQKALEVDCDEGNGPACSKLGDLLRMTKSEERARASYARACTFKRADACHKVALMWREGTGGEVDPSRADALEAEACKYGRKKSCASAKTSSAS